MSNPIAHHTENCACLGKKCSKCQVVYCTQNFHKNRSICRACRRSYGQQWYRENKPTIQRRKQAHRSKNKERLNEQDRKYREEHKEQAYMRSKRWYATHKRDYAKKQALRLKRQKEAGGSFTRQQWRDLQQYYNHTCLRCRRSDVKLTPDHVIPIALDGNSDISNIQPLCMQCNTEKGIKTTDYRIGFFDGDGEVAS